MGVKTEITRSLLLARLTGTQVEVVAPGFRSTGRVTSLMQPFGTEPTVTMMAVSGPPTKPWARRAGRKSSGRS
jgi:nitrogenase molybdenum-iron protein alpha/beta subunit